MTHTSINMEDMPIEVLEFEPINPLISKCQIKVCYVGDEPNRNKSIITKDVAKKIAPTIPGCPIVGYYNEKTEDFDGHNRIIDISNGKFQVKDTTRPYGFVPTDAKVWFQWFEDDGVQHEYLCTEGYIWTGQYPESQRIIDEGNNQSMELDDNLINAYWTKDSNGKPQFFIINEAIMSKLCILGEDVEPCFEGASISKVQFSFEDEFKNKLFSLMEKMQEILSNEGGTPVFNTYAVEIGSRLWDAIYDYVWMNFHGIEYSVDGIFEEGGQKFAILRNRKDLTYYRLNFSYTEEDGFKVDGDLTKVAVDFKPLEEAQFAAADVEAYELQYSEKKAAEEAEPKAEEVPAAEEPSEPVVEEPAAAPAEPEVVPAEEPEVVPEEPVVESHEDEEKPVEYNLEEIVEYQELLNKYSELEGKITELQNAIAALTKERDTLASFKNDIDREKKKDLIHNTFYMLSDDVKKEYIDNIDKYSYDDIEKNLSVICVRNKVSFDLTSDSSDEKEPTVFNLDSVEDDLENVPAWVKRTLEVKKEKNLN